MIAVLIAAATTWAWLEADEAADALRLVAGCGAGLMLAGLIRIGDDAIAGRLTADVRDSLARTVTVAGAAIVPAGLVLARGIDLGDDLGVMRSAPRTYEAGLVGGDHDLAGEPGRSG